MFIQHWFNTAAFRKQYGKKSDCFFDVLILLILLKRVKFFYVRYRFVFAISYFMDSNFFNQKNKLTV